MTPYKSKSYKTSGVTAFSIGPTYIDVLFGDRKYRYSYKRCGMQMTEQMKQLALASKCLSTFISKNDPNYE